MIKRIAILGSTGSIGTSTIDIVKRHPDRFQVVGLVAGSNLDLLVEQINDVKPEMVAVRSVNEANELRKRLTDHRVDILHGSEGACTIASLVHVDMVVSAIVGAAGLLPTMAALNRGKMVGLANKESMVIAGELMSRVAKQHKAVILPIDSEHSALFQCLEGHRKEDVKRLILTASGGPFLKRPKEEFATITIAEALKHPNWAMGQKITIDSATMMNKGLEVMEARWLYDISVDRIDICVHPQSIIHSMVEFNDTSVIAQLGVPDMRVPIAYALSYPKRIETGVKPLNLFEVKELTFLEPDFEKFPSLRLAYQVARSGGTYPAVLNAANEVVVDGFLKGKIGFTDIPALIDKALQSHDAKPADSLDAVLGADHWTREYVQLIMKSYALSAVSG